MKHKSRKTKMIEYIGKYDDIPKDYVGRLNWLCDTLNIKENKYQSIIDKRDALLANMYYATFKIILYEEPEGSPRPRFRIVNRSNIGDMAMKNSQFVHVYSITGAEDRCFMNRLLTQNDMMNLQQIIYTPCDVDYVTFSKTPSYFSATDKVLAEIGLQRPMTKPDWDNIGKKYSDMYNGNVWIDDTCVIRGVVDKYYSVLPRVEITLRFLNGLYNRHQYVSMSKRLDDPGLNYFDTKGELKRGK